MHARVYGAIGLALLVTAPAVRAQETSWQPAGTPRTGAVRLGRPMPLEPAPAEIQQVSLTTAEPVTRAQAPDPLTGGAPPPPPPFPGAGAVPPPPPGASPFECGTVNSNADQGGFFSRCGDKIRRGWEGITGGVTGVFQPAQGRTAFQSDVCFEQIISPVTNPFYFLDPRALTEVRPIFIWQHTPNSNPIFAGGNNYFAGAQARLAFTQHLSLVIEELGFDWTGIDNRASPYHSHFGFAELHLGPQYTFIRNEQTGTLLAGGLIFEIPTGPSKVFTNTGTLSLDPYFSFAQNFWRTNIGSMNFVNTTGYEASVNNQRNDAFWSSFHLDYNVLNLNKIFPLVELNWWHYTFNGNARPFNFGGQDLFNFGSTSVAGRDELTLAVGARYKVSEHLQFGIAPQFNVLNNSGGRHLDNFRLTADMILRY